MAYDSDTADRIRQWFAGRTDVVERKMFGGLAFLVRGHMCCGVLGTTLVARVGPEQYAEALKKPHVRVMDFTGRPMTGLVTVAPDGFRSARALRAWIERCERFVRSLPPKKPTRRKPPIRRYRRPA